MRKVVWDGKQGTGNLYNIRNKKQIIKWKGAQYDQSQLDVQAIERSFILMHYVTETKPQS